KGDIQEGAALKEIEAIGLWKEGRLAEASEVMLIAGREYAIGGQPLEAFMAHIRAAYISYKSRSNVFWEALEYIRHRIGFYAFVENDHFYKDFVNRVLMPILSYESNAEPEIRLWLFGGMKASGMKEPDRWFSKKALSLFKYLILNQSRGIHSEYLSYLLWPRADTRKGKSRLKVAAAAIRKELGPLGNLLIYTKNSYVLRESQRVWVDVHEFQNLLREAESLEENPVLQMEKYIAALKLYGGKLLPEDRYDRYIDEHRDYFHKRFQKALEKTVSLLIGMGKGADALDLCARFHMKFPDDNSIMRTYINALVNLKQIQEARKIYDEFRKRLWREHRLKPSFDLKC
ncbi:MAG: BTAD domain-containing putative transcriptional regulator, partial [candidate division WOR-3 bacterium]